MSSKQSMFLVLAMAAFLLPAPGQVSAQTPNCSSVLSCADRMAEIGAELSRRVAKLESDLAAEKEKTNQLQVRLKALDQATRISIWVPFDWSGQPLPVPEGWTICDGDDEYGNRLPNLNGRFLMGVSEVDAAGVTGEPKLMWRRGVDDSERHYLMRGSDIRPPRYSVVFLCRTDSAEEGDG